MFTKEVKFEFMSGKCLLFKKKRQPPKTTLDKKKMISVCLCNSLFTV